MTEDQETVGEAPGAMPGSPQRSVSRSPSRTSIMTSLETQEAQATKDTSTLGDKAPNRREQRAQRARERAIQAQESAQKSERRTKKAEKHARRAEKHSRKAEKYARKAEEEKTASEIQKLAQKAKKHAETALKHAANAQKYVQTAQEATPQPEQGSSQGKALTGKVSKKKRGREEDNEDQQLPPKKRSRKIKSPGKTVIQEESVDDQPTASNVTTQRKRAREEEEVVENQPPAKKHRPIKNPGKRAVKDTGVGDQSSPVESRSHRDSSIEEDEVVEDEDEPSATQHSEENHVSREEEDVVENEQSATRTLRSNSTNAAASTPTTASVSKGPVNAPSVSAFASKQYLDYIKQSRSAKLRSMEIELKRRLEEQEQADYSTIFLENNPEHNKEVSSILLQNVQAELKTRRDAAPPKNTKIRSYSKPKDEVPNALKTLYRKYRSQPPDTFTYFAKLPAELRIMIWQQVEDPRIVKIEMVRSAGGTAGHIISRTEPPSLFLTCHESREVALKMYKALPVPFSLRLTMPKPIWVNYDSDTIFHHRSLFRDPELFRSKDPEKKTARPIIKLDRLVCDLSKVRSLAFDAYLPQQKRMPSLGHDINACKALEQLTLVLGETYSAQQIPKGQHCPIIKGSSNLNRVSRPPLLYAIRTLHDRNYITWNVDASKLGAEGSVRGQFRDILHKEKKRERGAIRLLEAFHKEHPKFKKQWEDGPKKKPYPNLCPCHMPQHEHILELGRSAYEPFTSTKPLGKITPEVIIAAIPWDGIKRADLVDKLKIRSYSVDAQLEFHAMSNTVLFKGEDEKLRPKKDGPLDITREEFAATIPVGGVTRNDLYRPDHIPPDEAKIRSKWEKRRFRLLPIFPQFSTYSEAAKKEFLEMVESMMFLGADGKLKLKENAPLDITRADILKAVPPEGITNTEIYTKFDMRSYSPDARKQFASLLQATLAMRKDKKLYPKRGGTPEPVEYYIPPGTLPIPQAPVPQATVAQAFVLPAFLSQVVAPPVVAPVPQANVVALQQATDPGAGVLDNLMDFNTDLEMDLGDLDRVVDEVDDSNRLVEGDGADRPVGGNDADRPVGEDEDMDGFFG